VRIRFENVRYVSPDPITNDPLVQVVRLPPPFYMHNFHNYVQSCPPLAHRLRKINAIRNHERVTLVRLQYPSFVLPGVQGLEITECSSVTQRESEQRVSQWGSGHVDSAGDKRDEE
jgi:hypothetical protein